MQPFQQAGRSRRMRAVFFLLACAAVTAASPAFAKDKEPTGEERLAKILAGRVPGKPQACAPLTSSSDSQTIPGVGIVYTSGRTFWLNRFENGCSSMTAFDTLVTVSPEGRLCRGDIARVIDSSSHIFHGSCAIGSFVPYTKTK